LENAPPPWHEKIKYDEKNENFWGFRETEKRCRLKSHWKMQNNKNAVKIKTTKREEWLLAYCERKKYLCRGGENWFWTSYTGSSTKPYKVEEWKADIVKRQQFFVVN
jgi:hypothetical protein